MSNVVINPFVFPVAGGNGITFTWDPENSQALPGGTTFTRASVKLEYDGTDYTELSSGTIPENSAAVGGGAQGFHPEPAATNQMISTDLDDAAWTQNGISTAALASTSILIDGNDFATTVASGGHFTFDAPQSTGNGSAFYIVQADTAQFITLRRGDSATVDYACADIVNGTVTEEGTILSSDIVDLGNGWYKFIVRTNDGAGFFAIGISDDGTPGTGGPSFSGTGENFTVVTPQYEKTPYETSPIVTAGSTATREADVLDTGVAITTAFSALLDITLPLIVGTSETITLLGPDTTAEDILRVDASFNIIMDDGGTPVTIGTASAGARIKVAYGRDAGDRSASLDGATAVDGGAPGAGHVGENFELGSRAGINQSRCIHHLTTLYDNKKSDAELEALST